MMQHYDRLHFFFGTASTATCRADLEKNNTLHTLARTVNNNINEHLADIIVLKQMHSSDVVRCDDKVAPTIFSLHADSMITSVTNRALAVLTADCLPLILYNKKPAALAVVHAGWRGALGMIAAKTVQAMVNTYDINETTIHAFLGPCAHACCYIIQEEVIALVKKTPYTHALEQRGKNTTLNIITLVSAQLRDSGIREENIITSKSTCTMCTEGFCSFRVMKNDMRNITLAYMV